MEMIKGFVMAYWVDIATVVVFVMAALLLLRNGKKKMVYAAVLDLVVRAEKELGSGTGPLKYNRVVSLVYKRLPFLVRALFTEKDIDAMIEKAVLELKKVLSSGADLMSLEAEVKEKERFEEGYFEG